MDYWNLARDMHTENFGRFYNEKGKSIGTPIAKNKGISQQDCTKTSKDKAKMIIIICVSAIGSMVNAMACIHSNLAFVGDL